MLLLDKGGDILLEAGQSHHKVLASTCTMMLEEFWEKMMWTQTIKWISFIRAQYVLFELNVIVNKGVIDGA